METRKVQQVGGGTYTVSLPRAWADEHGLEAGAQVYLSTHLDGSLVVRRCEREDSDLAAVRVDVDGDSPTVAERRLRAAYTAGFDRITLRGDDGLTSEQRRRVDNAVRNLTGVEVDEEAESHVTVREFLDAADVSVRQSVLQLRFIALSMQEAAVGVLAGGAADVEHIAARDDEADRVFALVTRHFNRALTDLEQLDRLGIGRQRLFHYYYTARQLERVADRAVKTARVADRLDGDVPDELVEELASLEADARAVVEDAVDAVIDGADAAKADDALDRRDRVVERARSADRAVGGELPTGAYRVSRVLDSLARTAEYGGNVAEVALREQLLA
jgi:phosphate uptake regulator